MISFLNYKWNVIKYFISNYGKINILVLPAYILGLELLINNNMRYKIHNN